MPTHATNMESESASNDPVFQSTGGRPLKSNTHGWRLCAEPERAAAAAALEPTAAGTASDDGAASAAAPVPTAAEAPSDNDPASAGAASDNGAASAAAPQTQPPPGRGPLATVPKAACHWQ